MDNILLLVFGICLSTLGMINIKGNISTIHSCNRRNVKEEDIPALARSAYADACRPGNPRETSVEDIEKLYRSLI